MYEFWLIIYYINNLTIYSLYKLLDTIRKILLKNYFTIYLSALKKYITNVMFSVKLFQENIRRARLN